VQKTAARFLSILDVTHSKRPSRDHKQIYRHYSFYRLTTLDPFLYQKAICSGDSPEVSSCKEKINSTQKTCSVDDIREQKMKQIEISFHPLKGKDSPTR
jgi:hypothetical protein